MLRRRSRRRPGRRNAVSVGPRLPESLDQLFDRNAVQLGRNVFGKAFNAIGNLGRRRRRRREGTRGRMIVFVVVLVVFVLVVLVVVGRERVTVWTLTKRRRSV